MKFTAKIRGKKWKIAFTHNIPCDDCSGLCDYESNTIYVEPNPDAQAEAAILIHETIHAAIPDLD